jgi:flagellar biosynthetic protein FliR
MIFLFAGCRMAGVVFMNPIFGRRNIPSMVKVGLALGIAFNITYQLQNVYVMDYTSIEIILSLFKEFGVGFAMGFVMQLFVSLFHFGGEVIDLQMGISMATLYDPNTNSQISISGNLLTTMYILIFFITNSHITLMAVAARSYHVIPIDFDAVNPNVGFYMVDLFGYILVYALQLALPVIIIEIIVEVAVGIMMRVVPNINVFVINLQLKLFVGLVVIITILPMIVRYMSRMNMIMLERLQDVLFYFIQ